jgi:uncharacterized protein YbjQ (UPF0145 family)
MRKFTCLTICLAVFLALTWPVYARDDKLLLPITTALETKDADAKLDGSVKFFFGQQKSPAVVKKFGNFVSNLKTNAVGKSDEKACNWVFLSTLLSFEKRAKELGANAVVNIVSYYQKHEMSSETEFECHAGTIVAGVALKGDFVTIPEK